MTSIPEVTAPAHGDTPVTTIAETAQFTGRVSWSPTVSGTFTTSTVYTATITLTQKTGYTLTGVAADFFTVTGATATNPVNSGVVTAVFPSTDSTSTIQPGIALKAVQGGTFNNGTADMTVSSFRMSEHEITGEQYAAVMGISDPSRFASVTNNPAEMVTWFDAVEFCNILSVNDGLTSVYSITDRTPATGYPITSATVTANWTANGYRLPTEAEWQFAARGGNSTHDYTYAGSNNIDDVAWYDTNSGTTTKPVGAKTANELGLYDMSGNVFEWCWDCYGSYPDTARTDYRGADSNPNRVARGGGWEYDASFCAVELRGASEPSGQYDGIVGFRVVCR